MVSAAEQMAANTSWSALGKATDLRNRILFTLGLLIVYRLGTYIPVPGIDAQELRNFFDSAAADAIRSMVHGEAQIDALTVDPRHRYEGAQTIDDQQTQREQDAVAQIGGFAKGRPACVGCHLFCC